jgi:hypothetical protein
MENRAVYRRYRVQYKENAKEMVEQRATGETARRRVLGALYLVGIALAVIGFFPPWIRRVFYFYDGQSCNLPTDPGCRLESDVSVSIWQSLTGLAQQRNFGYLTFQILLILVSIALPLLFHSMTARAAFTHRAIRVWAGLGLALSSVILAAFLLVTRFLYCFGTTACGVSSGRSGFWTISPGYSVLEPGFWLIAGGLVLPILLDLYSLFSPRPTGG